MKPWTSLIPPSTTEGVRARDQQEKALKHFEGTNAIRTWLQLVGTLHFAYLPTLITMLYETMANQVWFYFIMYYKGD